MRPTRCRFNGAADFHPRKRGSSIRINPTFLLQWGRGLPSAETQVVVARIFRDRVASMGPRTSIRGNSGGDDPLDRARPASMGPRTSIRGNFVPGLNEVSFAALQWGRGLPSAETRGREGDLVRLVLLQWGRGLPSAETTNAVNPGIASAPLQWGRGLPSAETRRRPWRRAWLPCFNGAADFHPRKRPVGTRGNRASGASMGPRTSIRGNLRVTHRHSSGSIASMGPRTSIRGNQDPVSGTDYSLSALQWGRGLPSAET